MSAPRGNQFWKQIKAEDLGRNPNFRTPQDLWDKACNYFESCDQNPIQTEETTETSKGNFHKTVRLKIPYTWQGLYIHLGICNLNHYKNKEAFSAILTHIGNIIYNQKFTGATTGIFNANIIARDLDLVDKTQNKNENNNKNTIVFVNSDESNKDK